MINHGIKVGEEPTGLLVPLESSAGLQVVIGTAPVNLAEDPYAVTNKVILATDYKEAVSKVGFSEKFMDYTLCQSIDMTFNIFNVGPIVLINVLDPEKHVKENAAKTYNVANGMTVVDIEGILLDTLVVKDSTSTTTYVKDIDYVASFTDEGYVRISIDDTGTAKNATKLTVSSKSIDPSMVTKTDIIGGVNVETQEEKGLELIRQVYPKLGMVPGQIVVPKWSKDPEVAAVMQAKCENINGVYSCVCYIDIDTTKATTYDKTKEQKEKQGVLSNYAIGCWPLVKVGDKTYNYSANLAAVTAYLDAKNKDVPYASPSNKSARITAAVLEDGTEVTLDQEQANVVNSFGLCTVVNDNGWKTWGNYTAGYPNTLDVKDMWICCRRMLSWWENGFINTFKSKVDDPMNFRLVKNVCDTENIRANSYVNQGMMAGLSIEFREKENSKTDVLSGHMKFHTKYGFFTPAQTIENIYEFDPNILYNSLFGGE